MLANEQLIKTKNNNKTKYTIEKIAKNVFMISALIAVISLLLIIGFVFYNINQVTKGRCLISAGLSRRFVTQWVCFLTRRDIPR